MTYKNNFYCDITPPSEIDRDDGEGVTLNFKVPSDEKIHFTYRVCIRPNEKITEDINL